MIIAKKNASGKETLAYSENEEVYEMQIKLNLTYIINL